MIANLLMASGATVIGEYSASINPAKLLTNASNGNFQTPFFEAIEQNGVGPFEYKWSFNEGDGGNVVINSPTEKRTNLNISSSNDEISVNLSCKIIDKGNNDEIAESSANIFITFGDLK